MELQIKVASRLALGSQKDLQVSSKVYASRKKKKHFKADISCISLADCRLMDVT